MGVIETKTFKDGDGLAVLLPAELGFVAGMRVEIEKIGGVVYVRPVNDAEQGAREVQALADELDEIWRDVPPHPDRGRRDPIIFPKRRGL